MRRLPVLALLLTTVACDYNPDSKAPVKDARVLTRNYTLHAMKAYAAGTDCRVLLVRTAAALDDATVETIHYGDGESSTYPGGLQQFAERRRFRAVAYRDETGGLWTYGSITRQEAETMPLCR